MFKPPLRPVQRPYRLALTASALASLLLSGCGIWPLGPDYARPALQVPATLSASSANTLNTASATDFSTGMAWWQAFQDPTLNALLDEAANHNQDLALVSARIDEARSTLTQTTASIFPTLDLNAGASRNRASQNSATYVPSMAVYTDDRKVSLSTSYEIDFWGRMARANEAARARLLAQEASRGTVLTTLYASVAQTYFALRALDAQQTYGEQTLATRQENLRLQQRRFEAGVIGQLDLSQAQSEAAAIENNVQQTRQTRANTEAALALLLGRSPAEIAHPKIQRGNDAQSSITALYARQVVPANLPSDLLNRRPDLIAAEQALIAANADIGQARAAYFPRLSLTAVLGEQSKDLSNLFNPTSLFWNVIGNLTQPIFRAGTIGAQVSAANARQQQALAQYTQAVQAAFRDVHDALNNADSGREMVQTATRRIEALRTTLRLAELRYKNGYSSYLEVLNAQRDLSQAEASLIDAKRVQLNAVVSVYKALGGGWEAKVINGM